MIYKKKIKGSSLTELLVFMVISGFIFLIITEGYGTFHRFTKTISNNLNSDHDYFHKFYILESLVNGCDSIVETEHGFSLYKNGNHSGSVFLKDSVLFFNDLLQIDTVYKNIHSLDLKKTYLNDTLTLYMTNGNEEIHEYYLHTPVRIEEVIEKEIFEYEKDYTYK